jgi:transcriptional regulator of aromatic amino acid metabolism
MELSDQGTLFLDEAGDMSVEIHPEALEGTFKSVNLNGWEALTHEE